MSRRHLQQREGERYRAPRAGREEAAKPRREAVHSTIAWLDRGVSLLPGGYGPLVVGVTSDCSGGALLQTEWERESAERGRGAHHG